MSTEAEDRASDVELLAVMFQGAVMMSLDRATMQGWVRAAKVEQPLDDQGIITDYTDVVLSDGWRVRFTRSVVPPTESEETT